MMRRTLGRACGLLFILSLLSVAGQAQNDTASKRARLFRPACERLRTTGGDPGRASKSGIGRLAFLRFSRQRYSGKTYPEFAK